MTDWYVVTLDVEAVKAAEDDPAATVTDAGTDATAFERDKATATPPAGAGPDSVSVHVLEVPPGTVAGAH